MPTPTSPLKAINCLALGSKTATQGSPPIFCAPYANITAWLTSVGTTSGGTILIEESDDPAYGGTWSQLASIAASSFTGGAKLATHLGGPGGSFNYAWVRFRISADITGGGSISGSFTGS